MFPLVAWLLAMMAEATLFSVFLLVVSLVLVAETVQLVVFFHTSSNYDRDGAFL